MPPRHGKEDVAPLVSGGIVVDLEGTKPATQAKARARWNAACDSILLDTLAGVKARGRQADNAGWHTDAYTLCAEQLKGAEKKSGGPPKTARMCLTRWTAVCAFCVQ
jgi:hypothetical protein